MDPMEPPKFRHKEVPRGTGSPPVPIMHSPPRAITVKDQQDCKILPCISNWQNPKVRPEQLCAVPPVPVLQPGCRQADVAFMRWSAGTSSQPGCRVFGRSGAFSACSPAGIILFSYISSGT